MDKKVIIWVSVVCLVLLIGGIAIATRTTPPAYTGLAEFAQCLTGKGAVMYGAASCSHCQSTKNTFGESFSYIDYVECPDNIQNCIDKGIDGYPTWIFGDGTKLEGERTLEELAETAGCPLQSTAN